MQGDRVPLDVNQRAAQVAVAFHLAHHSFIVDGHGALPYFQSGQTDDLLRRNGGIAHHGDGTHLEQRAVQDHGDHQNHRHHQQNTLDSPRSEELLYLLKPGLVIKVEQTIRVHHIGVIPVVGVLWNVPAGLGLVDHPIPEGFITAVEIIRAVFPQFRSLFGLLKRGIRRRLIPHRRLTAGIPSASVHGALPSAAQPEDLPPAPQLFSYAVVCLRVTSAPKRHS